MIYFLLVLLILTYIFFLNKNKYNNENTFNGKKLALISVLFSIVILFIFSLSYNLSDIHEYKKIHDKNVSVRKNIKTIKENVPILESRLINSPSDFNGWLMLGKSYSILNNYQKASRAYQVAINLRPNNMDVIKEYILVLRSDSENINKEVIKKYFKIYLAKTNDPQGLIDQLSFAFSINDTLLAESTLNSLIKHPEIVNKNQYKNLLTQLINNKSLTQTILDLNISTKGNYPGYFFIVLKQKNINQPFAIKRIKANKRDFLLKITKNDFMIKENSSIPNEFDFIIKHSPTESFSQENRPTDVYKREIKNYNSIKNDILKINF
jgi:tetratricopeptide (TPR) repeat protein